MKEQFVKVIIWLFEKYCYDYWVDLQTEEENKRLLKKYKVDNIEEAYLCETNDRKKPMKEAYEAGRVDGYNKAFESGRSFQAS